MKGSILAATSAQAATLPPIREAPGREAIGKVISVGPGETYDFKTGAGVVFIGPGAYAEYTVSSYMQDLAALTLTGEVYNAQPGEWALVLARLVALGSGFVKF
ncbi:NADPH:quinone reductase [Aspergillus hancockii]|nr:NADPH:quinone reductase [Aspergillus hancockii]